MPRTAVTVRTISRTGLDRSTLVGAAMDVANGNTVPNNGRMWLEVKNTNAAATTHTLSISLSGTYDGQTITPKTQVIPAGKTWMSGMFPVSQYGGDLAINGDHAELQVLAFALPDN